MVQLTVEVGALDEGNVHTQVAVVGRAVQAQVDAEGHAAPGRIFGAAIEADLVGFLALQLLEDFVRLALGRQCGHRECGRRQRDARRAATLRVTASSRVRRKGGREKDKMVDIMLGT